MSDESISVAPESNEESSTPSSPLFKENTGETAPSPEPKAGAWLPESLAGNPYLSSYESAEAALTELASYKEARDKGGFGDLVKLSDDPADVANVYAKLGKPESADKYDFKFSNEAPEGIFTEDEVKAFKDFAHESNFTQSQYEKVMDFATKLALANIESQEDVVLSNLDALTKIWGNENAPSFSENQRLAQKAYNTFADPETLEHFKGNDSLSTDPYILNMLAKIGRQLENDVPATSTVPSSKTFGEPVDPKRTIEAFREANKAILNNPRHPDHPAAWKQWLNLHAQKNGIAIE